MSNQPGDAFPTRHPRREDIMNAILVEYGKPKIARRRAKEIAQQYDCSVDLVRSITNTLRKGGKLPTAHHANVGRPNESNNAQPEMLRSFDASKILDEFDRTGVIDANTRKHVLSLIIANSTDANRIRAISQMESIEASKDKSIGPPPPLSHTQKVDRLASLMAAVGEEVTDEARKTAFPQNTQ